MALVLTIRMRSVFFLLIVRRSRFMANKGIEQMSKGVFRLNAGSLFVAFQRLQRAGLIRSEWKATENCMRARYCVLTEAGRRRLNSETREWAGK